MVNEKVKMVDILKIITIHYEIPVKPSLHGICETLIFHVRVGVARAVTRLLVIIDSMIGVVLLYPTFKYTDHVTKKI